MTASDSDHEALVTALYEIGAVRLGRFTLHSGRTSLIYLDLRLLVSYPHVLRLVTTAYQSLLADLQFDLLAATPLAGLPIGTAIGLQMDVPLIYPRKTAKSYGTGKSIEGKWVVGQTAVVIDDLVTSGDSILQAITPLKAAGLQVIDAVVLIDRQQGGVAALQTEGYRLHAVLSIDFLLQILVDSSRISAEQREGVLKSLA